MSISIYFSPSKAALESKQESIEGAFSSLLDVNDGSYFPEMGDVDIAVFSVYESRNTVHQIQIENGWERVREQLYKLYPIADNVRIADLGNILQGETIEDTYFALSQVVEECIKNNVFPLILGNSQDLTFPMYQAYEKLEQVVNLSAIDSKFDLGEADESITDENYLTKIILHKPNYLFNFCNLGHQSYLVDNKTEDLMKDMYFDVTRLGELQQNISLAEPMLRFSDILSVDLSSIRYSEYKASSNSNPNGFYGDEICQLMRYAGISDKLSSLGLFNYQADMDEREQGAKLIAQMIWCFVDGYYNRKKEHPSRDKSNYQKFIVPIKDAEYKLTFYKSDQTSRWWLEVPFPSKRNSKYERHQWVPCSYEHYKIASKDEMPDIWWKTYQKLG